MANNTLTRIQNNQIYSKTIVAKDKVVDGSITGALFDSDLLLNSNITIAGNLAVYGNTSTINSINTYINDPLVVFNNGYTGSLAGYNIGMVVNRNWSSLSNYGGVNTAWVWNEGNQAFEAITTATSGNAIVTLTNSGFANVHVGNLIANSLTLSTGIITAPAGIENAPIGNITPSYGTFTYLTTTQGLQTANARITGATTFIGTGTTLIADAYVNTGYFQNLSAANAYIYGAQTYIGTGSTLIANIYSSTGYFTNLSSGNAAITGAQTYIGTGAQNIANIYVNTGFVNNFSSPNTSVGTENVTILSAANFSSPNICVGGGYLTGLQNVATIFDTVTNFYSGNVFINGGYINNLSNVTATTSYTVNQNATQGNVTTLYAANFNTSNAAITGAQTYIGNNGTPIANISAGTGYFTNLSSGNAVITGTQTYIGTGSTLIANIYSSTGYFTNLSSGNAAITGAQTYIGTGSQLIANIYTATEYAQNLSTANAFITGGYIDNMPIGANVRQSGAFTTLTSNGITTVTSGDEAYAVANSGALQVTGGASFTGNVWVGGNLYVANLISATTSQLVVQDPLVYFQNPSPQPYTFDVGFYSDFVGGPVNVYGHSGLVRQQSANSWVFFSNIKSEPTSMSINWNDTGIIYDKVKAGDLWLANTTASTSTTTGALRVDGGAGIAGAVYTGSTLVTVGNIVTAATTTTVDTTSGALVVKGGIGAAGVIITGGNIVASSTTTTIDTNTGAIVAKGGAGIGGVIIAGGNIVAASGTASTNTTTGALVVIGGTGIGGAAIIGGNIVAASGTASTNTTTGALVVKGGAGISGAIIAGGNIVASNNTATVDVNSGALVVTGGTGIGGVVIVGGNIVASSTTTTIDTNTGAIVAKGGAGIAGVIIAGGNIVAAAGTASTNTTTGALVVEGGAGISGAVYTGSTLVTNGNVVAAATTSTTDTTTGALVVKGGIGAAGAAIIGGNIVAASGTNTNNPTTGALVIPAGGVAIGGNAYIGSQLFVGIGSQTIGYPLLNDPLAIIRGTSIAGPAVQYAQSALINSTSTGSSDWIAYGNNYPGSTVSDHGWMDMGFTGDAFDDPAFTITKKNDGYIFASGANASVGGNLIIATDYSGNYNDVIIGVGSFYANSEVARFHGNATNNGTFTVKLPLNPTPGANTAAVNLWGSQSVGGNLYVGQSALFNGLGNAGEDFIVKGAYDNKLLWARAGSSGYDQVLIGNNPTVATLIPYAKLQINSDDSMLLPSGDSSKRPGSQVGGSDVAGMFRYNTVIKTPEWYDGASWQSLANTFTVIQSQQFDNTSPSPNTVDGVNTTFTLLYAGTTQSVIVSINGVVQIPTLAYGITGGTTLTFTEAPAYDDYIDVRILTTVTTVTQISSSNGYMSVQVTDTGVNIRTGTVGTGTQTTNYWDTTGGFVHSIANVSASSANVERVIDTFGINTYRSAKYVVQVTNGSDYQTSESLVVHNGTTAIVSTYGTVQTNGNLGTLTANVSGLTTYVNFVPANGTTSNIRISKDYFSV